MEPIYIRLRERARQIAAELPQPDFYCDHLQALSLSKRILENDPMLKKLRRYVRENPADNFGHGLAHAVKVAEDAGALMVVEAQAAGYSQAKRNRRIRIVQCAGLLHDIERKQKDHARRGAEAACRILEAYPLKPVEIKAVGDAIRNHEAFKEISCGGAPDDILVSDCLYDADKFRWGPDNFTHTLWDMLAVHNPPLGKFMDRYPEGMASLEHIKSTFRSASGKTYGPQFIDLGMTVGRRLYDIILAEFPEFR